MQAASSELLYVPIYSTLSVMFYFLLITSHSWWYHLYSAVCNLHASYLLLYCCFNLTNRHNAIKKMQHCKVKDIKRQLEADQNQVLKRPFGLKRWRYSVDTRNTKTLKTCSFWVCVTICCHQVVSLYLTLEVGLNKQDWKPWFEEWS